MALSSEVAVLEARRNALLAELAQIDAQLSVHRAFQARSANEASPLYRLPEDILRAVLHLACKQQKRAFHVVASHVCHRWRNTVLMMPLLWNTPTLIVRPSNHTHGTVLARLHAHITRSAQCSLDITLFVWIPDGAEPYFQLVAENAHRLRKLSLVSPYDTALAFRRVFRCVEAPILEHLSLHFGKPQDGALSPRKPYSTVLPTILAATPPLVFLRLAGVALGALHPPSAALTTLHLDGWTRNYMTHDQLTAIVKASPALVNLSINQLSVHHPRDPLDVPAPTELPHLRHLRIRGPGSPVYRLLSLLRIPALESVTLLNVDTFDAEIFTTVTSLTVLNCAFDEDDISNLVRAFPSVVFLSVDSSVADIFFILMPSLVDPTAPIPWTALHTLSVRDLPPMDVAQLCNMVLGRRDGKLPLSVIYLDRRSRTALKTKDRLTWVQDNFRVEQADERGLWPPGLGYDDPQDLLE